MDSELLSAEKPKMFRLDMEAIRQKAEHSYRGLLTERPNILPYTLLATEVANSNCQCAPQTKMLLEKVPHLISIRGIYPAFDVNNLYEFEEENIEESLQDLNGLGIAITKDGLIASLKADPGYVDISNEWNSAPENFMELAEGLQREYLRIFMATRIFEGTGIIIKSQAPLIPQPLNDSLYYFRPRNDQNGGWTFRENGGHILSIDDWEYDLGMTLEDMRRSELTADEYYDEAFVTAAHERGHAALAELFDRDIVKKSLLDAKKKKEADLRRALHEGYAILNEQLMSDTLEQMVPALPASRRYNILSSMKRKEFLKKSKDHPKARAYLDGYRIIRRLIWQLGLYNSSKKDQIIGLSNFFRKVDFVKASTIKPENEGFEDILKDPLNRLPILSQD